MSKPEKVFKAGAVRASVFRNVIEKSGELIPLRKVVIEVRYRDKNGEWKGTNSLSLNELPKAITALRQAYEYLLSDDAKDDPSSQSPQPPPKNRQPTKTMSV